MFEKELKFICDFSLNKISKAGSFLTFEKLKGIELHPAILKYISAEIDFQIYKDRQALLQKSSYDYSGAEISKYFKMIALEIKKSKRISEKEINDLISQAVVFNFDFTTKPNETFSNFVFKESESLTPDELTMSLDSSYYYSYIRQILLSYLEKKQLLTVNKKEFEFLLSKIDSELFPAKTDELLDDALTAISDFFNIGAVVRTQIPAQAIELYLKEKNLTDHLTRLDRAVAQAPKVKYEIDELKKIIYAPAVPVELKEVTLSGKKSYDISVDLKPELSSFVKDDLLPKSAKENKTEDIDPDEFEITKPGIEETIDLSEELDIEEDVETFPLDPAELEQTVEKNNISKLETKPKNKKDIISFLSAKEIQKIISSIFNEDKEDFATTIETISDCKSYENATEILKTLYTTYNVNPYSRDAILLTNAVAKYFTVA